MTWPKKLRIALAVSASGLLIWAFYPGRLAPPLGAGGETAGTTAGDKIAAPGGAGGVALTAAMDGKPLPPFSSGAVAGPAAPSVPVAPHAEGSQASSGVSSGAPSGGVDASKHTGKAPRRSLADLLEGVDLSVPGERERVVAEIAVLDNARKAAGIARARELGLPLRVERPDGTVQEVAGIDNDGNPVYFTTHNVNAAVSTAANLLQVTPYGLRGTSSLVLAVWDGGSARASHQEFGGRVSVRDGSGSIDHATHVAGTMIAAGLSPAAKGMAPAAPVASYDWNGDKAEMTAAGAATAIEAVNATNKFLISNHSYGYIAGWNYVAGGSPYRVWEWYGNGTTNGSAEADFGMYNTFARDSDSLAFAAPYFLMFRSAGNERNNNPAGGQAVALAPGSGTVAGYDPAVHPAGDGTYRGGFENISFDAVAKNVVTVGSVLDAVSSGTRDPSRATPSSFSSFGPTDDGRIKPDLVANGESVYSSLNSGDASYGTYSGTSMSSPNAAGTAALLAEDHVRLFGQAMRSSMLKGLLIHTADDRGHPGPDYKYGWGLINAKAATDLIRDHHANPLKSRMIDAVMPTGGATVTHEFVWDGVSPIRATVCWTDPAGSSVTTSDFRSPRLRNNLDLKIVAPDGAQHMPFTMPFVGTWSQASMDQPATTGTNNTDNVEQVYLANPGAPGVYRAVVSFQGTLANDQVYSLLISGSANEQPPPPALAVESVSPGTVFSGGVVNLQLSGASLAGVDSVRLTKEGQSPISAVSLSMVGEQLICQINLAGAASGRWNIVATKGAETSLLSNAVTVVGTLYGESFDGTVAGWSAVAGPGAVPWTRSTVASHSPTTSYFAAAPGVRNTNVLTSAAVSIPANAGNLQLRFWHSYNLEAAQDGGRLQISADNGATWLDADAADSGVIFAANGYTTTISARGRPADRSEFQGKPAWSGNSGGFVETVLSFADTARFSGKTVRFRWVLASNASVASPGWHVDSIVLVGGADSVNQPPSITSAAAVPGAATSTDLDSGITYHLVAAASAPLHAAAADDGGEASLTYTWTATGPGPVFFPANSAAGASSTRADFERLGDYQINVTVTDGGGLSARSTLYVRVGAVASALRVTPSSVSLGVGGTQQFEAVLLDQFGGPMDSTGSTFTWKATGGGTVGSSGLFTATQAGENFAVVAGALLPNQSLLGTLAADGLSSAGETSDFAQVTVTPGAATVSLQNTTQTYDGLPKMVVVATDPPGLAVSVTYDGSATAPSAAGSYAVEAVVTDANYQGGAAGTLLVELSAFDAWRLRNFGETWESNQNSESSADADGDGASNHAEYFLGTDPADPGSRLRASAVPAGPAAAVLTVAPAAGEGDYRLKWWSDLGAEPQWVPLPVAERAASASFEVPAVSGQSFYQIFYTPPPLPR